MHTVNKAPLSETCHNAASRFTREYKRTRISSPCPVMCILTVATMLVSIKCDDNVGDQLKSSLSLSRARLNGNRKFGRRFSLRSNRRQDGILRTLSLGLKSCGVTIQSVYVQIRAARKSWRAHFQEKKLALSHGELELLRESTFDFRQSHNSSLL